MLQVNQTIKFHSYSPSCRSGLAHQQLMKTSSEFP